MIEGHSEAYGNYNPDLTWTPKSAVKINKSPRTHGEKFFISCAEGHWCKMSKLVKIVPIRVNLNFRNTTDSCYNLLEVGLGFLFVSWAPSRHKSAQRRCSSLSGWQEPLHSFTHPPALRSSSLSLLVHILCTECVGLLSCPFLRPVASAVTAEPDRTEGQGTLAGKWPLLQRSNCCCCLSFWPRCITILNANTRSMSNAHSQAPQLLVQGNKLNLCSCTVW